MEINSSGSTVLYLQLQLIVLKKIRAPPKAPENCCRTKFVEKCRKTFWHFLMILTFLACAKIVEKQICTCLHTFDKFWRFLMWPLPAGPFYGPQEKSVCILDTTVIMEDACFSLFGPLGKDAHEGDKRWSSSRKGSCRSPREFYPTKFLGEFSGRFFCDFLGGLLPWRKQEEKSTPKSTAKSNPNLGVSRPKSTLQGSGLERTEKRKNEEEKMEEKRRPCTSPLDRCPWSFLLSLVFFLLGIPWSSWVLISAHFTVILVALDPSWCFLSLIMSDAFASAVSLNISPFFSVKEHLALQPLHLSPIPFLHPLLASPSQASLLLLSDASSQIGHVVRVVFMYVIISNLSIYRSVCLSISLAQTKIQNKKGLLQKSEGNFSDRIPRWILQGIFWWIFSGLFPWKKTGGKHPPKNPRQNSNRNLGVSRPNSTLQGSGLENFPKKCRNDFALLLLPLIKFFSEVRGIAWFGSFAAKIHTARIWIFWFDAPPPSIGIGGPAVWASIISYVIAGKAVEEVEGWYWPERSAQTKHPSGMKPIGVVPWNSG